MQRDCLFCESSAGSKEHLWPAWIHQRKDFGPLKVSIGGSPVEIRNDPAQKIDTVCHKCNNEWMSRVENKTKPIIACMLEDLTIPLDRQQQNMLSNWAVKTAMVFDSVKNPESNPRFYQKSECVAFRERRVIPDHVRIWIGRSSLSALGAYGTDVTILTPQSSPLGAGTATTIVTGHLAVQAMAFRFRPEFKDKSIADVQPKLGDWNNLLVQIWPIVHESVMWPPKVTFTNSGPHPIATLMDRWRIGKAI